VVSRLRPVSNTFRYQHKLFDDTPMLRERSRERTPGFFVRAEQVRRHARWTRRPIEAFLRWLERAIPDDPAIRAYIDEQRPDLVLVTPLIALGSSQIDYVRLAAFAGHSHCPLCLELGPSLQQGAHPGAARSRVRLERHAESGRRRRFNRIRRARSS
jgi:hypothetical protein